MVQRNISFHPEDKIEHKEQDLFYSAFLFFGGSEFQCFANNVEGRRTSQLPRQDDFSASSVGCMKLFLKYHFAPRNWAEDVLFLLLIHTQIMSVYCYLDEFANYPLLIMRGNYCGQIPVTCCATSIRILSCWFMFRHINARYILKNNFMSPKLCKYQVHQH